MKKGAPPPPTTHNLVVLVCVESFFGGCWLWLLLLPAFPFSFLTLLSVSSSSFIIIMSLAACFAKSSVLLLRQQQGPLRNVQRPVSLSCWHQDGPTPAFSSSPHPVFGFSCCEQQPYYYPLSLQFRALSTTTTTPATTTSTTSNRSGGASSLWQRLVSFTIGAGLSALVSQYYLFVEVHRGNKELLQKHKELLSRVEMLEKTKKK